MKQITGDRQVTDYRFAFYIQVCAPGVKFKLPTTAIFLSITMD